MRLDPRLALGRIIACAAARSLDSDGGRGDSAGAFTRTGDHIHPQKQGAKLYPIAVGRQVSSGLRQSMPESKEPICAGLIATTPSAGDGHRKRPFSSRRT